MHVSMHVCTYACMSVCVHVRVCPCRHVRLYARMYACTYVCMHACMHVCMDVCMYIYIYMCAHVSQARLSRIRLEGTIAAPASRNQMGTLTWRWLFRACWLLVVCLSIQPIPSAVSLQPMTCKPLYHNSELVSGPSTSRSALHACKHSCPEDHLAGVRCRKGLRQHAAIHTQ